MFERKPRGLLLVGMLLWGVWPAGAESPRDDVKYAWKLNGTEILLELEDCTERRPSGIYVVDPFAKNPKPRLLIKGGARPTWSPHRRYFAYLKAGRLRIADRKGLSVLFEMFPTDQIGPLDPPVRWTWQEGFFLAFNYRSVGNVVCDIGTQKPGPRFPRDYGRAPLTPLFPLKRGIVPSARGDIQWDDLLVARSMDRSLDGGYAALEVAPFLPDDMARDRSKIFVYPTSSGGTTPKYMWFWQGGFPGPGRRLTSSGPDTSELRPLWSPTGEWIAFAAVHLDKGYVAPAVCKPDGTGLTELLPKNAQGYTLGWPDKWTPLGAIDFQDAKKIGCIPDYGWGTPSVWPLEWSADGRYLLVNQGPPLRSVNVAKWENGEWKVGGVATFFGGPPLSPTNSGINFAAFGPVSRDHCWIVISETFSLWVVDLDNPRSGRDIFLPDGLTARWVDW